MKIHKFNKRDKSGGMISLKFLALLGDWLKGKRQCVRSRLSGCLVGVVFSFLFDPIAAAHGETYHWVVAGHEEIGEFTSAYTACEAWVEYSRVQKPELIIEFAEFYRWTTTSFRCAYRWRYVYTDWWGYPGGPLVVRKGDECSTAGGEYSVELGECVDRNGGLGFDCTVGNPISVALGYKFEEVEDIPSFAQLSKSVQRRYRYDTAKGEWTFSFQRRIEYRDRGSKNDGFHEARLYRPDGRILIFTGTRSSGWKGPLDEQLILKNRINSDDEFVGWTLLTRQGVIEQYNVDGELEVEQTAVGDITSYRYEAGRLHTIEDADGNSITVEYDVHGRVVALWLNSAYRVGYEYDSEGRLLRVEYPDGSAVEYRYEDSRFPSALTGIMDGNGRRYASWTYDSQGRAVRSEHAGG